MNIQMEVYDSREDWLAARKLGGSAVSAVVGKNPWMDNVELWEILTGIRKPKDISDNELVIYGSKAEEPIRQIFILDHPELDVGYEPNNLFKNFKYPWATASLDGWMIEKETDRIGVLEIKTNTVSSGVKWEEWKGRIPEQYFCQVIFYLAITEADFAILRAHLKLAWSGETIIRDYRIEREDVQADIDYLMEEAEKFMKLVETKTRPGVVFEF